MTNYTRPDWVNKAPVQYQEILEKHDKWLNDIVGGQMANLRDANLRGADLRGANLRGADLVDADLRGADLRGADLRGADLRGANLGGANLFDANLRGADLRGANLGGANLGGADLRGADLRGANLGDANLVDADLLGANLVDADLGGANLGGADLFDAYLETTKKDFLDAISLVPDEVPFLRQTLVDGKINGSSYTGECACLAGTIAKSFNFEGKVESGIILGNGFKADVNSPRERWFMAINPGDTPENHPIAKITLEWIDEFLMKQKGEVNG